ncbi:UvrD-helicase domain-containing protein [Trueperella pecoris]|uniref:ATP-dependent DNA helicase UvrD1 n=1 Tax=Trueperella pecoris TaxID=2733571 RepID=A0A7M1R043_9ACTO|nr:UvrD-helicase domain-containing protein [Trueperella pecoris]QOR47104.1 UvrD-helicase domain-containing protein [Trueperella pecoris]
MSDAYMNAMDRLRARVSAAQQMNDPRGVVNSRGPVPDGQWDAPPADGRTANAAGGADESMLAGLNAQQRAAVVHASGHLLVVAGAGSGKTRVLTTRISHLIASGKVRPSEILAITFTNKAAKEMRERLEAMIGPTAQRMWISTFHSACVRILRSEHEALGMRSTFTIYDSADSNRLMTMVVREENIDGKQFTPKALLRRVSDLKNEMVGPGEFERRDLDRDDRVVAQAYSGYQRRLRAANAVDFDDLIMLTVKLLRDNTQIAEHYRRRFRHILVDEYQDTNVAQYELIRVLVGDESDVPHGELTVVGDADQSIYAFRGATIRNIQDFEQDFPNATSILLEQNYRSTQNILSAANAVIANNAGRRPKRLWTDSGSGEKIVGYVADAESDEAAFVVEEIDQLRGKGYVYGDMAVFYRTNAQSRSLEEMFVRSGIPYKVVGGTKFYERKEIKDAIAYLQAIANPDDTVSIRRILNEPRRGLGAKAEDTVAAHAARYGMSFGAALTDVAHPDAAAAAGRTAVEGLQARAANAMREFVTMLEDIRGKAEAGAAPADVLDEVMDRSGYLAVLQKSNDPQDEVRVENLAEFHSVASDFSVVNDGGTLGDFLDQVSLVADSDQIPDGDGGEGEVVLMTVHTAKGLEFPVVFVTGMEDGTFPHIRAMNSPSELEEERRLAYVAFTRARQRLYITRAGTRSQWGAPQELPASRFLEEIPADVIDWRRDESSMQTLRGAASWGRSRYSRSWNDDDDFAPAFGAAGGAAANKPFVPSKFGSSPSAPAASAGGRPAGALGWADASSGAGKAASGAAGQTGTEVGKLETTGLAVGDKVRHKSFGVGKIIAFEGQGRSTIAKVKFNSGPTKRLMLRFAPLEKVS